MLRSTAFGLAAVALAMAGCGEPHDGRDAQIRSVIASADEAQIRARPALVAGKYAKMAAGAFDFYRGNIALFRNDMRSGTSDIGISRFALAVPLVPSLGDPHPENFGVLRASDGSPAIEPNDFDAADRAPYLWDVRRLTAGLALAAMVANAADPAAQAKSRDARRAIARVAAEGYAEAIAVVANGGALQRIETPGDSGILKETFDRSERDYKIRRELDDSTVVEGGARRLKRGVLDPEEPSHVYANLDPIVRDSLEAALGRYRASLAAPPPPETFTVLDAVREFGSGVASWPRIRIIALVRGPTDDPGDDLLLEVKEIGDSTIAGAYPPGVYHDSVTDRVVQAAHAAWARPDAEAYWGAVEWLGAPFQVRLETEGEKGLKVARFEKELGTPDELSKLARILGGIVARAHTRDGDGEGIAKAIHAVIDADREGFLDEQADIAMSYADSTLADRAMFANVLRDGGPRLGVPFDPLDAPPADLAVLLGTPPPLPEPLVQ